MATFEGMTEEDQLNTLMAELKDSNIRQSVMEYIANKTEVAPGATDKQRLSKMIETIAAESVTNQKQSALWKSRTKKSILLGIVAVIVAITVQFLVNFFSNELSKESHVTSGTMVGTDGSVVKTQLDEMRVNADGQLQGRSSVKTIKTTPSLNRIALASSLPDSTLMALDEITVYSDKGHTLRVKVHGFARVPVLNSRCGNLVHFYTAWNGRVTLDSTELSFDKDTESQFKDAGFSLAVGGFGGRRLAGGTQASAFFKHVDKMKKSGSWTCADVPLPVSPQTSMSRETQYDPCLGLQCYSKFGGLQMGVAKIADAHALAAMTTTERMRTILRGAATEVFYRKMETTNLHAPSYALQIKTIPVHFGQEKITLADAATDKSVTFQLLIGNREQAAHCASTVDEGLKEKRKAVADPQVDTDVQLVFIGLVQEGAKVLRHWGWIFAQDFSKGIGANQSPGGGEYWDHADTLIPYRLINSDGTIHVTESFSPKCTDADVSAALALRTKTSIKDLMDCKVVKADESQVPKIPVDTAVRDLDENEISWYMSQVFGDYDSAARVAAAGEKDDMYTELAQYLVRGEKGWSDGSVSDPCYLACKDAMDLWEKMRDSDNLEERNVCRNGAHQAVVDCLHGSHHECQHQPWIAMNEQDCSGSLESGSTGDEERALEEEEETDEETLVPAKEGASDLVHSSPTFQAALAQSLNAQEPKISMNSTTAQRVRRSRRLKFLTPRQPWAMADCWCAPKRPPGKNGPYGDKPTVPTLTAVTKNAPSKCDSCTWSACWYSSWGNLMATLNWSNLICISFSVCVGQHVTIVIQIKFSQWQGCWMFNIMVEICIGDYQRCFGIPDPFYFETCVGGQLHIYIQNFCPGNSAIMRGGKCYLRKDCRYYLTPPLPGWIKKNPVKKWAQKALGSGFLTWCINFAGLEVGILWGHQFHKWIQHYGCYRSDPPRRRRRSGKGQGRERRRRRTRQTCRQRRVENCDTYCKWYVYLKVFSMLRLGYEQWEWTKSKMNEGFLVADFDRPDGWDWGGLKWKWQRLSTFLCFRKYNRR